MSSPGTGACRRDMTTASHFLSNSAVYSRMMMSLLFVVKVMLLPEVLAALAFRIETVVSPAAKGLKTNVTKRPEPETPLFIWELEKPKLNTPEALSIFSMMEGFSPSC